MRSIEAGSAIRHLYWLLFRPVLRMVRAVQQRVQLWRHPVGRVQFGALRRLAPISERWGFDRGLPIDRHYVETFLAAHAADVRGRVLEVGGNEYTRRFGHGDVARSDVLHVEPDHPATTIVADLASGEGIPDAAFDCVIVTQTLQLIYDLPAAVRTLHRMLAPGGTALITVPGVTHTGDLHWQDAWCWSFTAVSLRRLLGDSFGADNVHVDVFGNVLAATSFLHGIAADELRPDELAHHDARYPLLICARACKAT